MPNALGWRPGIAVTVNVPLPTTLLNSTGVYLVADVPTGNKMFDEFEIHLLKFPNNLSRSHT